MANSVRRGRPPAFTPEQDLKIAQQYEAGSTVAELCAEYGVVHQTMTSAIRRGGAAMRPRGHKTEWTGSPEQVAEVVRLHRDGWGVKALAALMHTRDTTITQTLHDNGVSTAGRGGRAHKRFTDEEAHALADEWRGGVSIAALSRRHDTSDVTIRNTLRRIGAHTKHEPNWYWTDERVEWLRKQHESGRSLDDIAAELDITPFTVKARLRAIGAVEPPKRTKQERRLTTHGYVEVLVNPEDMHLITPYASGYAPEHRLVMARALGRPLRPEETVHHLGANDDNRIEKLQLRQGQHGVGRVIVCGDCGSHNLIDVPIADDSKPV